MAFIKFYILFPEHMIQTGENTHSFCLFTNDKKLSL